MDFNLPEELQMLKDTVRKFVEKELIPIEMHTIENMELKPDIRERLEKKTKEMGLWMFDVPEEYGGGGLGSLAQVLVWEELARTVALPSRGQGIFGPEIRPILYALNDDQKKRFMDPIMRGEKKLCFMQTEPDAGSDPASMKTRAVRQGDYYIVNGTKRFITGAGDADFGQLMAVTDPAKAAHGGISCFMIDMKSPGLTLVTKFKTMMGEEPWQIAFDDMKVPVENLVGKEGEGFKLAQKWLGIGRLKARRARLGCGRALHRNGRALFQTASDLRQAIVGTPGDHLQAGRLLCRASRRSSDGLPGGVEERSEARHSQRGLHGEAVRRRDVFPRRRPRLTDPRRYRSHARPASGEMVRRSAQPHDHRRRIRSHAHGHRPRSAKKIQLIRNF